MTETLGHGELLGWSWHFPLRLWHPGASRVRPLDLYAPMEAVA
ncbi:hypothetical protein [Streptomyces sp. NPDC101234]